MEEWGVISRATCDRRLSDPASTLVGAVRDAKYSRTSARFRRSTRDSAMQPSSSEMNVFWVSALRVAVRLRTWVCHRFSVQVFSEARILMRREQAGEGLGIWRHMSQWMMRLETFLLKRRSGIRRFRGEQVGLRRHVRAGMSVKRNGIRWDADIVDAERFSR